MRKLFRLWARNEGIPTEEWDNAEGVWGLRPLEEQALHLLMDHAPSFYIRVMWFFPTSGGVEKRIERLSSSLFVPNLPIEKGHPYYIKATSYPYVRALLIAADVYSEMKGRLTVEVAEEILARLSDALEAIPSEIRAVLTSP